MSFQPEEKVRVIGDPVTYDFGYYSKPGWCVLYYDGECNMQDSFAVETNKVRRLGGPDERNDSKP